MKEMATHSSIPAGRIPWTEEPSGLQSMGMQSQTRLSAHTHTLKKSQNQRPEQWLHEKWEKLIKGYGRPVTRGINSKSLMCSMVSINNI